MSDNKASILIVEDSRTQAIELQYLLENNDYEVLVAKDGLEALAIIKQTIPDVIITDIVMPNMNGYELCRAVRHNPEWSQIPVILLTSLSAPDDVIEGLKCGADNFLTKPFDKDSLLSRLHYILINRTIRTANSSELGLKIFFGGKKHTITAERAQILDLFFSSFETALQKNRQLETTVRQLRETQDYLRKAKAKVEDAMEKADEANKAKSRFLSNMTHELRTPLSAIIGMADLLFESELNYEQNEYVSTVKNASECLLALVNDILDLSEIESSKVQIEQADFDLLATIELISGIFRKQTADKKLDYIVNIDPQVPQYVVSDETRIRQILINLLGNAVKFTQSGSVTLNVRTIGNTKANKVVIRFEVVDTGIGIPKEQQQMLLEAFVQAENDSNRTYSGTGLGLAIVNQLVRLLESRIEIDSQPDSGSTFAFELNLTRSAKASAETLAKKTKAKDAEPEVSEAVATQPEKSGRIMIVEDNRVNQLLLSNIFKKFGCEVDIAKTGREACDLFEKEGDKIDLIFMDLQMPVMDGWDATRNIREIEEDKYPARKIPIIALTANDSKEDREKCLATGMDDHLSKPFRKQLILECLNKWL